MGGRLSRNSMFEESSVNRISGLRRRFMKKEWIPHVGMAVHHF